ncbi:FecR domain-containing protein [Mesorhizobium sp. KR9-304]|uniref:FecR family protein n=1 Tax=Mesorhizobium sp. KR9-304 TaxID=3156614 RepID=UPI0032B4B693
MKSQLKTMAAATAALISVAFPAVGQEQVGQATLVRTAVTGDSGPIAVKSPVYRDERIRTSANGLGEFRFADGTKFAVGGNSSVVIDRFIYDSSKTFNKLTLNAARGSFRWISGKSKSEAYEIVTPAGTIGIRGTRLEIFVGSGGVTAVVLLSGAAQFCGSNGCQDLRRRCDVVVATPRGGVSEASRVNRDIFATVGSDQAFPFLSGRQQLSSGFRSAFGGNCGLSAASGKRTERGDSDRPEPRSAPEPEPEPEPDYDNY